MLESKIRPALKIRPVLLGLMAVLLLGACSATAAYAEGGPYFHHRLNSSEGKGSKIEEKSPENISGTGGEQLLKTEVDEVPIQIKAKSVQVKGVIYNNANQGQAKILLTYQGLASSVSGCTEVKLGENGGLPMYAHQTWKWNGTKTQLEELNPEATQRRDWLFLPREPNAEQFAKGELPKEPLIKVTLGPSKGCLVAGSYTVTGDIAGFPTTSPRLGEWSKAETISLPGSSQLQHEWDNGHFIGFKVTAALGAASAAVAGEIDVKPEKQEIAYFEE